METILHAEHIFKSFNKTKEKSLEILKDVSLEIEKNKITSIIGASGAGKSTLLHIISGLDKADKGKVTIKGENISEMSDDKLAKFRNKHIGFIFQFHHLLPEFTALENVAIPQMINGIPVKTAVQNVKKLLDAVGLTDRSDHKPAELSGGEQQRVAVARALANNPEIIFADEPTGNLDSKNSEVLHKLFIELKDQFGLTFLIVSHNPELVKLADKVHEMKDGRIFEKT